VCRASSGIPLFRHVFLVMLENTSLDTLVEHTEETPFLHQLLMTQASSSNYHGVAHPSLPNYLALISGATGGVACDCNPSGPACTPGSCTAFSGDCGCPQAGTHLGTQLDGQGSSWRVYAEAMGAPCNLVSAGSFAARHVPFLYYQDLLQDPGRCAARVVDMTALAGDLMGTPPSFAFLVPGLDHDMHDPILGDSRIAAGDRWLAEQVPALMASPAYLDAGAIFLVWDEDDLSGLLAADDPLPFLVISPLAKQGGFRSTVHVDHYSLLATLEDGLGLPRLGQAQGSAPLSDLFPDR
jgi:hypothetical protein